MVGDSNRAKRIATVPRRIATISTASAAVPSRKVNRFYLSPAWRALMQRLINERGAKCEKCGRSGCRIFGDHIIELRDDGDPLAEQNIQLLCGSCHTSKTSQQRDIRMRATYRGGGA